jgi:hypothetical protein
MSEAFESLVCRNDTQKNGCDQRAEGDDVVTPTVPDEEAEHAADQYEEDNFIGQRQGDPP